MKKLLSVALILVMVCSLWAVPAMAAITEAIVDGGFEGYAPDWKGTNNLNDDVVSSSGSSVVASIDTATVKSGTQSLKVELASGKTGQNTGFYTNNYAVVSGTTYTVSFDVYPVVPLAAGRDYVNIRFTTRNSSTAKTSWGNVTVGGEAATWSGSSTAYAMVSVPTNTWSKVQFTYTPTATVDSTASAIGVYSNETQAAGTVFGYFDNVSITSGVADPEPEPSSFNVTISGDAGANVSVAAATSEGEAVNYIVTPKFGYYIASVTVGGTDITAAVDAYKGGTYSTGAIEADTEIVVRTASYAANDKGVSTDVATLPSAFASTASTVTFGKVLDDSATSYGVELTQNGQPVLTYHGGGPLYKANSKNANGQYAVEFVGLPAGEYTVRTYVIVNGTKTFGAPATFVVE